MRTHIVLWKWRQDGCKSGEYTYQHVNVMYEMLLRHTAALSTPARIVCVTDEGGGIDCETHPLWADAGNLSNASGDPLPSCYRRLKLYDPETQRDMGIEKGDRILGLDLDTVVCNDLRQLLATPGRYVGWKLAGAVHEEVYNGSFQMFTAGDLSHIWSSFDPATSPRAANQAGYRGSDQSWLSMNLIGREGCTHLEWPTLSSFPLHNKPLACLSKDTRMVFFNGRQKPWTPAAQAHSPWIQQHWR